MHEGLAETEYFVVYKLDNATPQAYASKDGTLVMSELPPGVHTLVVQLLTGEGLPLTVQQTKVRHSEPQRTSTCEVVPFNEQYI